MAARSSSSSCRAPASRSFTATASSGHDVANAGPHGGGSHGRRRLSGAAAHRRPGARAVERPRRPAHVPRDTDRAAAVAGVLSGCARHLDRRRSAAGMGARAARVPGQVAGPRVGDRATGASAGRRWRGTAAGLRPARSRPAPSGLHDVGCHGSRGVRGDAVPDPHCRRGNRLARRPLRAGVGDARLASAEDVPPGDAPTGDAGSRRGSGARVGARTRGVRRDHHLRRQPARPDADTAARRLRDPRPQPGRGGRPVTGAAGAVRRRAGRDAGTLAGVAAMTLDCQVDVHLGDFRLSATLNAGDGEVVALVGPNGTGKSTLLRALAGLTPMTGSVRVDDRELAAVPPEQRNVGWVPQSGALFPHLSAQDNVAYGLGGRSGRAAAQEWLDRLGIGELAGRKPAQLSGGQAQKVALARALARSPRLLLLDEPLTALDVTARVDVRRALRTHLADYDGVTVIVTHDAVDAVTFADRVVALDAGVVVQDATPAEITRAPRTPWLAQLMGANAFPGRASGATVFVDGGGTVTVAEPVPGDVPVLAVVPAHAVSLHSQRPSGTARNAWPVVVRELIPTGGRGRGAGGGPPPGGARGTPQAAPRLRPPG